MEAGYLVRLPADIRELVEGIEHSIGFEIEVRVEPREGYDGQVRPNVLACEVEHARAVILIPTVEHFPDGSVLHELLHIRRFLLEGIPQIVADVDFDDVTPQVDSALRELDNSLEHMVIVPEELQLRPGQRVRWVQVMRRFWRELSASELPAHELSRQALVKWAFLRHVLPEPDLLEASAVLLDRLGCMGRAEAFSNVLIQVLPDKAAVVKVCCEYLEMPERLFALKYLDCENHTSREVSLTSLR